MNYGKRKTDLSIYGQQTRSALRGYGNNQGKRHQCRALSLADTKDFGILRIIVHDTEKAVDALKDAGYAVTVNEIVAITIPDSPGQLSRVLEILGKDNVNLEYLYAFTGASDRAVSFVLRVNDNDAAAASLTKGGIIQLTENDIADM